LRTKIITWTFVPTAIVLFAVALVTFNAYQQVTQVLVIERDRELTRLSASQLATELSEYSDLLATLARTMGAYWDDLYVRRDVLERAGSRLADFDAGVAVLDTFGTVVAAEPGRPEILGQDWSDRAYYLEILDSHVAGLPQPVFGNITTDGPGGAEVIVLAVPVTGQQGEFLGTVAGMFHLGADAVSAFYGDIVKLRIGESCCTYLVDGDGRVVYHSDADRIGEDFSAQPVVQQVLSDQVGAVRTRNFDGRDIVASFAPVPGTPWSLITEESWATLIEGSRGYQCFLLFLLGVGLLVPTLLVAVGVRRITKPIEDLTDAAQEVARGNFGQTIAVRTGGEVEELARQFNLMSAQLQESYAHLEQRVAERTKELAALYHADEELYRHLRLDEVLQTLVDVAADILGADKSSLMTWNDQRKRLVVGAAHGFSPETTAHMSFALGEGVVGRVAASGEPIVVEDVSADLRVAERVTQAEGIRSFMHTPIEIGGQIFGVFNVSYTQPRAFGEDERRLFAALAQRAALAIENAQLYKQAQELAVMEERGRLARDLHDAVTQTLFSASLIADVLPRLWERDPDVGRQRLEEVRQLTRGALAEMRTLLLELRPASLVEAELGDLLRQLGEATTGRARVPVAVKVEGRPSLPSEVKVAFYRIVQEALNNVAKHAGASHAAVSLQCRSPDGTGRAGRVELRISDDGRGFDPTCIPPDHLGVSIMHERAEAIGATLTVESEEGRGTEITVVW
jgi:nitrate/nitrite-specific signal transduction histidine kinase